MIKKLFCIFLFLLIPSLATADFPDGWSCIGYVDLPAPSATLTDFPVVIAGMPASMLLLLQSDLEDFRPTLEDDGGTECHYEIPDTSSQTTANAEIWIKIGSYSTSGNGYNGTYTRVFIWGNNSSATAPAADDATWGSQGVWDSSTLVNYHMMDATTSSVSDSTSNAQTGTKKGAGEPAVTTSGKIGSAQTFDGSNDYIGNSVSSTAGTYTVSAWIYRNQAASTGKYFMDCQSGRMIFAWNTWTSGGYLGFSYGSTWRDFGAAPTNAAWHYVVWTCDGVNSEVKCFVDGSQSGSTQTYASTNFGTNVKIGCSYEASGAFTGMTCDEFTMSSTERSDAWITTSYNNQNTPTTYGTWTSLVNTVTFIAGADGSLTGTTTQYIADGDDCTAVTAVADSGYSFSSWSGSYGATNPLTVTNVTTDLTITANFTVSAITALSSLGYTQLGYVDLPAPDASLTNFPVCLSGLPDGILAGLQQDFGDFRVTSNSAGTLPCAFEIVNTDSQQKCNSEIWIRVPSYSTSGNGYDGTDTRLFFWGNNLDAAMPDADDIVWGSQRVWGDSVFVSHMEDLTTSTIYDSSANAHNGDKTSANNPLVTSAKMGNGQIQTTDDITISSSTSTSQSYTISMWAKGREAASTFKYLFDTSVGRLCCAWNSSTSGKIGYYDGSTWYNFGNAPTDTTWHHIAFVFDKTDGLAYCYLDNVQLGDSKAYSGRNIGTAATIGSATSHVYYFDSTIDEFSIDVIAQSAAWIDAMYTNQTDTAGYGDYVASFTPDENTWYVGNSGGTYGTEDGTSQANAWAGWDAVDWDKIYGGDTIIDFSNERFSLDNKQFTETYPLTVDGSQSLINGAKLIDNDDWVNVSGNIYRVTVTAEDCDYMQTTAPASPAEGEKWFVNKNIYTGDTMGPTGGRALQYNNGSWEPCDFFYDVHMAWVDGVKTYPVITEGTYANQTGFNGTTLTNSDYGGHADNYWVGCVITVQTAIYRWEASRITASTGNVVTFGDMSYSSLFGSPTGGSYIIGNYNQLTSEGQWAYDPATSYFYVYSADPDAHTWEYSDHGCGILVKNCYCVTIQKYTIKNTNDSAILVYNSPYSSIKNNSINTTWAATHLIQAGAITVFGDSPYTTFLDRTKIDGVNVSNNYISKTYNGQGIFLAACNGVFNHNSLIDTGDSNWFNGTTCGINGENASGEFKYNYIYYSLYSGILAIFATDSTISYNVVSHSMNLYEDGGCIYLADNVDGYNTGGNIVEYNRVEYYGSQDDVSAYYFDNYSTNDVARYNYCYNGPGGAAPSRGIFYINATDGVDNIDMIDNTACTEEASFIVYNGTCVTCTSSGNTWCDPDEYPYIGGDVFGGRVLLNFIKP